jgi:hypothetical protein
MVEGTKKEETQFVEKPKKIGIGNFEIVGVNPKTNAEILELGFPVFKKRVEEGQEEEVDDDEEIDYLGTKDVEIKNSDGEVIETIPNVKTVRMDFYLKEVKLSGGEPHLQKISFFLENREDKARTGSIGYINQQGSHTYVKDEDNLQDFFKRVKTPSGKIVELDYRIAKVGEKHLYEFLRKVYNMKWSEGSKIEYKINDFFKGRFNFLRDDIEEHSIPILVPITISYKDRTDDKGNTNTFTKESFFKAYAPGTAENVKKLNSQRLWKDSDVKAIRSKIENNKGKPFKECAFVNDIEHMIEKITDPEWGCKDTYYLGTLKDYVPEEDAVNSEETVLDKTDSHFR